MSAFLGTATIGGSVPGLDSVFATVGSALNTLSTTVETQLTKLEQASASISGSVGGLTGISGVLSIVADAVEAAKVAIRIPAVSDFQALLNGALSIGLQLTASLTDPLAYKLQLLAGAATVVASLQTALPSVQLTSQIAASAGIAAQLEAKILAIDLQLEALDGIAASIRAQASLVGSIQLALKSQLQALLAIQVALSVALAAIAGALAAYASMASKLATAGAYCFLLTGPLSGLGGEIDALTPSTGLSGSTQVYCPVVLVQLSDTPAVTAVDAVFKTT